MKQKRVVRKRSRNKRTGNSSGRDVSVELHLPEFDKKDINLHLSKNSLSISAHKRSERKVDKKDYFHEERTERHFVYSTSLPSVKPKKAKMSFEKGILKIKVPRED